MLILIGWAEKINKHIVTFFYNNVAAIHVKK